MLLISTLLISNVRLKLAENKAKGKQHPEAELLLFENYLHSSATLSSKQTGHILKNYFNEIIQLMTMKIRVKTKSKLHRHNRHRPKPRHGHKYPTYKMCLNIMVTVYILHITQ